MSPATVEGGTISGLTAAAVGPPRHEDAVGRHGDLAHRLLAAPAGVWRLPPGPRPHLRGEELARAIRRYLAHEPLAKIAEANEVSPRTLRAALRRAGVGPRGRPADTDITTPRRHSDRVLEQARLAREMRDEPGRFRRRLHREIAAALGVTRARVGQLLEIADESTLTLPKQAGDVPRAASSESAEMLPGGHVPTFPDEAAR